VAFEHASLKKRREKFWSMTKRMLYSANVGTGIDFKNSIWINYHRQIFDRFPVLLEFKEF
jgi:hypothetical protein